MRRIDSGWVLANDLCIGDELLGYGNQLHKVVYKEVILSPHIVYTFEVEKTHTFFVGKQGILTHNMALPTSLLCEAGISLGGLAAAIGSLCSSPLVIVGAILIATGCAIAKAIKRKKVRKYKIPVKDGNVYSDRKIYQTLDKRGDKRKKKRKQKVRKKKKSASEEEKKARNREHKPLTNEEARRIAKKLGYVEDKNPPFNSHNRLAFRKGNDWITPDKDGHKGGAWKRYFKDRRLGTYNIDLTEMIGS